MVISHSYVSLPEGISCPRDQFTIYSSIYNLHWIARTHSWCVFVRGPFSHPKWFVNLPTSPQNSQQWFQSIFLFPSLFADLLSIYPNDLPSKSSINVWMSTIFLQKPWVFMGFCSILEQFYPTKSHHESRRRLNRAAGQVVSTAAGLKLDSKPWVKRRSFCMFTPEKIHMNYGKHMVESMINVDDICTASTKHSVLWPGWTCFIPSNASKVRTNRVQLTFGPWILRYSDHT